MSIRECHRVIIPRGFFLNHQPGTWDEGGAPASTLCAMGDHQSPGGVVTWGLRGVGSQKGSRWLFHPDTDVSDVVSTCFYDALDLQLRAQMIYPRHL